MAALFLTAALGASPDAHQANAARGVLLDEIRAGGETLRYAVYVPRHSDPALPAAGWPLVLFLHGRGECGTDGLRQLTQGLPQAIFAAPADWPVIALLAQCRRPGPLEETPR